MFRTRTESKASTKRWNLFSKSEATKATITHPQPLIEISRVSTLSAQTRSTPPKARTQQHMQDTIKRRSIMISPMNHTRAGSTRNKHMSHIGFSSYSIQETTDPQELEFYANLMNPVDSSSTISCTGSVMPPDSSPDSLSSALEDYKLFTEQPPQTTQSETTERLPKHSSIPSLASVSSANSSTSVLQVRHSLWVGIDEEELEKDVFGGVGALDVFNDDLEDMGVNIRRDYGSLHRTSLIFIREA